MNMIVSAMLLAQVAGTLPKKSCFVEKQKVIEYIGDRACVEFAPARRISGLWVDRFEGSAFFEGLTDLKQLRGRRSTTWFSIDRQSVLPPNFKRTFRGNVYRVIFVGRMARDMDRKPTDGYGHFSMWPGLVLVDRALEWRLLGNDPRP
jgi:hypothetical protein